MYLYSQNIGSINGKVTDSESGLPLEGATVIVENSNFTVTDEMVTSTIQICLQQVIM